MKASLDTDITIHLYMSGQEELLFHYFDTLYMHQYLYDNELKSKSYLVYERLGSDIGSNRIKIVTNKYLIHKGIEGLFKNYIKEYEYLFDSGELHALALAKAMGLDAFVSDDTKEYGPHQTLVRELVEGVMPFAFYELLFLRYLSSEITSKEMHLEFGNITSKSMKQHPMNFRQRMLITVRRFSRIHGSVRDFEWISEFCERKKIDYKNKMIKLKRYLLKLE